MPSQCAPSWSILLVSQRFLVEVTLFHIVLWWKHVHQQIYSIFKCPCPVQHFLDLAAQWLLCNNTNWRMQNTFEPLIPRRHKLHSHQVDKVFLAKFTFMFWRTTTDFILGNLDVKYAWDWKSLTDLLYKQSLFSDSATEGLLLLPLALLASNNIVIQLAQWSPIPLSTCTFNNEKHVLFKEMCCSCSKNSFSLKNGRQKIQNSTNAHHPSKKTLGPRWWFQTFLCSPPREMIQFDYITVNQKRRCFSHQHPNIFRMHPRL